MTYPLPLFAQTRLAKTIALALVASLPSQVSATNYTFGEVNVSFDSTFSYGTSWRVEHPDNNNIGKANVSSNGFDFTNFHPALNTLPSQADVWAGQGSYSTNGDNGNLNYAAGKAFSSMIKGTHDLDINYKGFGLFMRGMYFYDFEMNDSDRDWTNPTSGLKNDPCRDPKASEQLCKDIRLLDAFVYGNFDLDGRALSLRLGRQVISWGESTLISHGISDLNPVDIARLRAPGAELKEAFIPFGALWASLDLTDTLNLEMFYQYQWEKTIVPAPSSYFSANDIAGDGGHYNNIQLGFASVPDMDLDYLLNGNPNAIASLPAGLNGLGDFLNNTLITPEQAVQIYSAYPANLTLRGPGNSAVNEPKDGGQYGLRLSAIVGDSEDTEVSLYYLNYHSRRPIFSGKAADFSVASLSKDVGLIATQPITEKNYMALNSFSTVSLDYVEDIQLYGLSFNTSLGETSFAGELSYRKDEPLQIDDVELLYAAMPQQLANTGNPDYAVFNNISQARKPDGTNYQSGDYIQGYILRDTVQAQATFTHVFGPTFGASQLTTLFEVGGIDIQNMPDASELRLNGPGTDRGGAIAGKPGLEVVLANGLETNPFPDAFSWGYRAFAKLDYSNVFAGVNVSPKVVFSHDVDGTTPDPLFLFIEDRKSISLGVGFEYQSRWVADFTYNGFWGGVGTTNQLNDRDYISFSIQYSI